MAKKRPPKVRRENSAPEFRLLIEHFDDPVAKKSGTAFLFRTAEEFQNFVYELVVETKTEDHKIFFNIVGLKTPMSDFPGQDRPYAGARWKTSNREITLFLFTEEAKR